MSAGMQKTAMTYFKVRLTTGAAITACIAAVMIVSSFFVRASLGDTGGYLPTTGLVKSGDVGTYVVENSRTLRYRITYAVEYTVDGKAYTAAVTGPMGFTSRTTAEASLKNAIGTLTKTVYYNPTKPHMNTTVRNREDYIMSGMVILGAVLLVGAGVTYVLRDNPFMCGLQVASNAKRLFFN